MAESFDRTDLEGLLCTGNDDDVLDGNAVDEIGTSPFWHNQDHNQESIFNRNGSESVMGFIVQSEESLREMVQKEIELVPKGDYPQRLRSGEFDMSFRREGIDWICKVGFFSFLLLIWSNHMFLTVFGLILLQCDFFQDDFLDFLNWKHVIFIHFCPDQSNFYIFLD